MAYRAVLFDIGDTLWHAEEAPSVEAFRRLAAERVDSALRKLGFEGFDPAQVSRLVWLALEGAIREAKQGDLKEPDYVDVALMALQAAGVPVTRESAAKLLDATYVSGRDGGKLAYPDAQSTLLQLRERGFLLAAVTNRAFGGERFREDLREAGLDIGWDAESVSVEVGFLKPHPELFLHALESLQIAPSEAWMVGNSLLEDVAGAQRLGIRTVWRRCKPDADNVVPDYTIDVVSDLLELPELRKAAE